MPVHNPQWASVSHGTFLSPPSSQDHALPSVLKLSFEGVMHQVCGDSSWIRSSPKVCFLFFFREFQVKNVLLSFFLSVCVNVNGRKTEPRGWRKVLVSFVRSCTMDTWSPVQLNRMKAGGNQRMQKSVPRVFFGYVGKAGVSFSQFSILKRIKKGNH